ncbi:MAG: M50 family metallopeptidase [Myxococcaceae bacterium]
MRSLVALLALGLLVALHEWGHFLAARALRIGVDRFKVGMGPSLISLRRKGTEYVLGLVPWGASVLVAGRNPHAPFRRADDLLTQPIRRRIAFLAAGSVANYLVALIAATALYACGTHVAVPLTVGTVLPGSAAARAGVRPGDQVDSLQGKPVSTWSELVAQVAANPGVRLELVVRRPSGKATLDIEPRADPQGQGRIGIGQQYAFRKASWSEAMAQAVTHTRALAGEGLSLTARLIRGDPTPGSGGPAELLRQSDRGIDGWVRMGIGLSLALALFYLLPFPSLDGGRMLFLAIEAWRKKPLNPRLETLLQTLGFVLMLLGAGWLLIRVGRL